MTRNFTKKQEIKEIIMVVLNEVRPEILDIEIEWDPDFGKGVCIGTIGNPCGLKVNTVTFIYSQYKTKILLNSIGSASIIEDILINAFIRGERL